MAISRNAPCPCGSGRKYKHCCLGRTGPGTGEPGEPGSTSGPRRILRHPLALPLLAGAGLAGLAGLAVGAWRQPGEGLIVALAGLLLVGGWLVVRSPPPSRGTGEPGTGLGFGMRRRGDTKPASRADRRRGGRDR